MCLLFCCLNEFQDYPLVIAANRDEYYSRPTKTAKFWPNKNFVAGKDLKAGGTWFGISRQGRWAALTNVRSSNTYNELANSRGELATMFLNTETSIDDYLCHLIDTQDQYNGFNLIFGIGTQSAWFSNLYGEAKTFSSGLFGLSNAQLDTPWPKVTKGKTQLSQLTNEMFSKDKIFGVLSDSEIHSDKQLPNTGIELELERKLSATFIKGDNYGTRCSSLVCIPKNGSMVYFEERTYKNQIDGHVKPDDYHSTIFEFALN